MERTIKTIGVLTSGGDAPGMNAAIRAVTRAARYHDINVIGIMRGYQGLIENEFVKFTSSSVSNTIQCGGTILKTARCGAFMTPEGRKKAYENMLAEGIDALVVIGGNGSLTGAQLTPYFLTGRTEDPPQRSKWFQSTTVEENWMQTG